MQLTKRVSDNKITETEYRKLRTHLNYSSLKKFEQSRKAFMEECILGNVREEKQTAATVLGSLVHALLADQFDEKFVLPGVNPPKGQMLELVENLYQRTLRSMVDGIQQDRFEILFEDAFQKTKYNFKGEEINFKGKELNKAVEMFEGEAELYYKEMLHNIGKTVVSVSTITQAEKLVEKLRSHWYTRDIVNMQSSEECEVFLELPILYEIDGVPFRSLLDRLVVNHEDKVIIPYDWKTSWSIEDGGFEYGYLSKCYYIQLALYNEAVKSFREQNQLKEYKIQPLNYVALDTTGWLDPVIYECTEEDIAYAWEGFKVGNRVYKGCTSIISEIAWHLDSGIWSSSKETVEKKGRLKLNIDYL